MSFRNSISILQEMMAAKKKTLPVYVDEGIVDNKFSYTVSVDGVQAKGRGITKKAAKLESAENALRILKTKNGINDNQLIPEDSTATISEVSTTSRLENPIGYLNEMAAQHLFQYPVYEFLNISQGEFVMSCSFLDQKVYGKGSKKKLAKKRAAVQMIDIMKLADLSKYSSSKILSKKIKQDISEYPEIIEKYNLLTLNDDEVKDRIPVSKPIIKNSVELETRIEEQSLHCYEEKMRLLNIGYKIVDIQYRNPYMIGIKTTTSSHCFLGSGLNREEAIKNGLKSVLVGFQAGLNFNKSIL